MRKELKNLWDEIMDLDNKERMFDLMSLMLLLFKGDISTNEYLELKEYANGGAVNL